MKVRCRFSFYEPAFKLEDAYLYGIELSKRVDQKINGGLACAYDSIGLLAQSVCRHGDHLEFGTLFGATAIIVAATKKEYGFSGDVYTIDNGQYQAKLTRESNIPGIFVMDNAELFDVADRIHTIKSNTYPLPEPVNSMRFESAFIDAGHDYENCHRDWLSAKELANIVVFHDYDSSHAGVVEAVRDAAQDTDWWLVHVSHHMAIMERKNSDYGKKAHRLER